MDPQANVVEATCLARNITTAATHIAAPSLLVADAVALAERVIALDEWRRNGGFDPYADPNAPVANPQANALLVQVQRAHGAGRHVRVFPAAVASLPDGYLYAVSSEFTYGSSEDANDCGIAPDGSVSS